MEWRCEWCGKPHEDDDPPCDNCGHGSFEKAIVQQPAAGTAGSTTVWVCTECGREHPKHSPPCSRCGNASLEKEEVAFDDVEVERVGYRDLLTTRYALGLVAVVILGGVLLLGLAGVIDIPGVSPGVPDVSDVPGDAETYDGRSLSAVEAAYLDRLNTIRAQNGATRMERTDRLDELATYYNQRRVKALLGSADSPTPGALLEYMDERCGPEIVLSEDVIAIPAEAGSAEAIGRRLAARAVETGTANFEPDTSLTGLDIHTLPTERVALTQLAC